MNISQLCGLLRQQLGASEFDRAISEVETGLAFQHTIWAIGLCAATITAGTFAMARNCVFFVSVLGLCAATIGASPLDVKLHEGTVVRTSRHVVQIPV